MKCIRILREIEQMTIIIIHDAFMKYETNGPISLEWNIRLPREMAQMIIILIKDVFKEIWNEPIFIGEKSKDITLKCRRDYHLNPTCFNEIWNRPIFLCAKCKYITWSGTSGYHPRLTCFCKIWNISVFFFV